MLKRAEAIAGKAASVLWEPTCRSGADCPAFGQRPGHAHRHAGPEPLPTNARPEIFFVGSGDYHHLTLAFIADLKAPISLIHFDNHPDWVGFAPKRYCGSWVNRALNMPALKRIEPPWGSRG